MISPEITKRQFLKGAAAFLVTRFVPDIILPHTVQARSVEVAEKRLVEAVEWIFTPKAPWQARYWFPLDPNVAARHNIITAHSEGGPIEKYAKLHRYFLGQDCDLQQELKGIAENNLNRFGGTREWAGYCHGLGHDNLLNQEPIIEAETFDLDGELITVTYKDRVGMGAIFYSGHIMWRPFLTDDLQTKSSERVQENLDWFMNNLITTGQGFIVNAPALGQVGNWYRAVKGITTDRRLIQATNFDASDDKNWVVLDKSVIKEVYYPLSWEEAKNQGVDERFYAEIPTRYPNKWKYDDEMDKPLLDRIRNGQ